jgi:predicted DNA-binding transcriptional regulator AlpA
MARSSPPSIIISPDERIITQEQAAEVCDLHQATLKRLRITGEGPPVIRLSQKRIGYRIRDLRAWLDARTEQTTAA